MTISTVKAPVDLDGVGVQLSDRWVLDHIDLRVEPGEPLGIAGPSGSGKTVLCSVLAGAVEPSRGSVRYGSVAMGEARPDVGLILQNHGLLSGLTAAENVAFPLQARGLERDSAIARVEAALAAVGLTEQKDRPVDELSGGQRQRVGVARALAGDPEVLVADEPTAELDPDNRERVLDLLLAHAARGNVVVIASDDPEVIAACTRVVHLLEGDIVRTTTREATPGGEETSWNRGTAEEVGAPPAPESDRAEGTEERERRTADPAHRRWLRLAVILLVVLGALDAAALAVTLRDGGSPAPPAVGGRGAAYLGVTTAPQPASLPPGARVGAVAPGSPAAQAGIAPGDVIVLFGPKTVRTGVALEHDLDHDHPGTRQLFTWVTRAGFRKTVDITLGAAPSGP